MPAKATKATKSTPPAEAQAAAEPAAPVKASAKAAKAPAAKAVRSQPAAAAPEPEPEDGGTDAAGADEFVPMNRAERRAKGRGKGTAQVPGGRGKVSGSHGPAHTQRNWANRRTG